jgi:hypothetical protein
MSTLKTRRKAKKPLDPVAAKIRLTKLFLRKEAAELDIDPEFTQFLPLPLAAIDPPLCNPETKIRPMDVTALAHIARMVQWLLRIGKYRSTEKAFLHSHAEFDHALTDEELAITPQEDDDTISLWFTSRYHFLQFLHWENQKNCYALAGWLLVHLRKAGYLREFLWKPDGRVRVTVNKEKFTSGWYHYYPTHYYDHNSLSRFNLRLFCDSWLLDRVTRPNRVYDRNVDRFCHAMGIRLTRRNQRIAKLDRLLREINEHRAIADNPRFADVTLIGDKLRFRCKTRKRLGLVDARKGRKLGLVDAMRLGLVDARPPRRKAHSKRTSR